MWMALKGLLLGSKEKITTEFQIARLGVYLKEGRERVIFPQLIYGLDVISLPGFRDEEICE